MVSAHLKLPVRQRNPPRGHVAREILDVAVDIEAPMLERNFAQHRPLQAQIDSPAPDGGGGVHRQAIAKLDRLLHQHFEDRARFAFGARADRQDAAARLQPRRIDPAIRHRNAVDARLGNLHGEAVAAQHRRPVRLRHRRHRGDEPHLAARDIEADVDRILPQCRCAELAWADIEACVRLGDLARSQRTREVGTRVLRQAHRPHAHDLLDRDRARHIAVEPQPHARALVSAGVRPINPRCGVHLSVANTGGEA